MHSCARTLSQPLHARAQKQDGGPPTVRVEKWKVDRKVGLAQRLYADVTYRRRRRFGRFPSTLWPPVADVVVDERHFDAFREHTR